MPTPTLDPARTVAELKELRTLTGDDGGAQRVAFTPTWAKARQFFRDKLAALPGVTVKQDPAGNLHAVLPGTSGKELLLGGHLDSVPNGGWLDGCLGTLSSLEVLRRLHAQYDGKPPVTIRLIDWADEEGARFGRSLFGSSAASGALDPDAVRDLTDKQGVKLIDAVRQYGVELHLAREAKYELQKAAAYLELHIEQGPVLESLDLPLGAVLGTFGVERHIVTFTGQAAHSGSTPMAYRKDALAGVSKLHLFVRDLATKIGDGAVATVGNVTTKPGIVTSVVADATMTLDMRHLDAKVLERMYREARDHSERVAKEENITVDWKTLWQIQPFPFNPHLIDLADQSIQETCGTSRRLPSGPLHDAAEVCRTGVPTVMLFVQSLRGISHNKIEDTREDHLQLSVRALDRLADKTIDWILTQ